jgi:hypothetical protein
VPHDKGGTFAEPALPDNKPPRFFRREQDAKTARTLWLRGPHVREFETHWETGNQEYVGLRPDPKLAKEPRNEEDWQVVKIYWGIS